LIIIQNILKKFNRKINKNMKIIIYHNPKIKQLPPQIISQNNI
jgi:hypothetical protein